MEKRKIYILTSLSIIFLLFGLAIWYVYISKQTEKINKVTELDLYDTDIATINKMNMYTNGDQNTQNGIIMPENTDFDENNNKANQLQENNDEEQKEQYDMELWNLELIHDQPSIIAKVTDSDITFVERKTGHIYSYNTKGEKERISGITIPRVTKVYTISENEFILEQDDGGMTKIRISEDGSSQSPFYISNSIMSMIVDDGDMVYIMKNDDGGSVIRSLQNPQENIWSSPLSQWQIQISDKGILVTQNASKNIPGYSYMINKTNGEESMMIRNVPGLITNISPNGTKIVYSSSDQNNTTLYLRKYEDKINTIPILLKTMADKCAWSNDSITLYCAIPQNMSNYKNLPDDWYKGKIQFSDNIWKINTDTGHAVEIYKNTGLDIVNITPDIKNAKIVFQNKTNGSLWALTKHNSETR